MIKITVFTKLVLIFYMDDLQRYKIVKKIMERIKIINKNKG